MGQIKVEKNAGGIEGLCVIEPAVHAMPEAISWRHTIKEIWKRRGLPCSLSRTISPVLPKVF